MSSLHKYARDQFNSLIRHLNEYEKFKDPEALHRLRVDVKKIKAVLLFLGHTKKRFKVHKRFLPFRKIFRRAGQLRDPGVHANILSRYQVNGVKSHAFDLVSKKLVTAFLNDISLFKKTIRKEAGKVLPFAESIENKEVRTYLKVKRKEIESGLNPKPSMKKIHKIRKRMKEVIYLSEGVGKGKKKALDFYKEMEELIGTLHDRQILLEKLKTENEDGSAKKEVLNESRAISKKIITLSHHYYQEGTVSHA